MLRVLQGLAGGDAGCLSGSDTVDEQAQQEEVEDKLKECIDNVLDKR